ncbi:hypothetical protein KW807_00815, partial [Candidatus Parcubacteria bacterium]|nr:hypothetical protein [Candidatus Parcubacteria bacterium]
EHADYVTPNGVFDQATKQAVEAFQLKYSSEVLAPWGISAPTGYVYITTLGKINQLLCGTGIPGVIKDIPHVSKEGKAKEGKKEGSATSSLSSVPVIGNVVGEIDKGQNTEESYMSSLASAFFTRPDSIRDTLQGLYELLLILVVLYVLGLVLESVLIKDNSENVRKKFYTKWGIMTGGLLVALVLMYFLKEWTLLLPLLIAFVASAIYMFVAGKKRKGRPVDNSKVIALSGEAPKTQA